MIAYNEALLYSNEIQRKYEEGMPSQECDNILLGFVIPLVGKKCSGKILESTFVN